MWLGQRVSSFQQSSLSPLFLRALARQRLLLSLGGIFGWNAQARVLREHQLTRSGPQTDLLIFMAELHSSFQAVLPASLPAITIATQWYKK